MRISFWLSLSGLLAAAACTPGASQTSPTAGKPAAPGAPAGPAAEIVPVLAARVAVHNLPIEITAIGTVEAYATISIKPQVGGQIMQVHFAEGQEVKQGDPLFTIDPRPYQSALQSAISDRDKAQAQLMQAQANRKRDEAMARNAEADVQRYASIPDKAAIAEETVEQAQATAQAQEATVQSDAAAIDTARETVRGADTSIENAKLQLSYCSINAPLTGRTGNLMVNEGNIVKANPDNALVNINQIQPIYVDFTVPEQYLAEVRSQSAKAPLPVTATIQGDNVPLSGTLTFIDNQVDRQTGTIRFKATFPNIDHRMWPGQYAEVKLRLAERMNALTLPSSAILTGQQGTYVYVVGNDNSVTNIAVKTGITHENLTEITQGLKAGDLVATDGQVRLHPGAMVEIKQSLQGAGAEQGSLIP